MPNKLLSVEKYFNEKNINIEIIEGKSSANSFLELLPEYEIPLDSILRAIMIEDYEKNRKMIITTVNMMLSYEAFIQTASFKKYKVIKEGDYYNKKLNTFVPIPDLLDIECILDLNILTKEHIYIPDENYSLIKVKTLDFKKIIKLSNKENLCFMNAFADSLSTKKISYKNILEVKNKEGEKGVENFEIPVLPSVLYSLLDFSAEDDVEVNELVNIIEKSPGLSMHIISWACSPYYGSGKPKTLQDAIVKLGPKYTINVSIALLMKKNINIPDEYKSLFKKIWEHSLLLATCMRELYKEYPRNNIVPDQAYLVGLLHNVGILFLYTIYPLNSMKIYWMMQTNPDADYINIEKNILGFNHQQLGEFLLRNWGLPEELCIAARWHHHQDYSNEYSELVQRIWLLNQKLFRYKVGIESVEKIDKEAYMKLDIDEAKVDEMLVKIFINKKQVDDFIDIISE